MLPTPILTHVLIINVTLFFNNKKKNRKLLEQQYNIITMIKNIHTSCDLDLFVLLTDVCVSMVITIPLKP